MAITMQRCVSITDGASSSWVVPVEEVDGTEFIPISSKDRSMFLFIFGKHDHVSIPMLDELKRVRTKASLKLGDEEDDGGLFNATGRAAQAAAKATRQQCKTMQALGTLPLVAEAHFPAVGNIQGLNVKCITSLDAKTVLRVELSTAVLAYLKAVFTHGDENGDQPAAKRQKAKVKSSHKGVCWRSGNQSWIATRLDRDGSKQYQTFRPSDSSEVAIADAEELAAKWVESDDIDS